MTPQDKKRVVEEYMIKFRLFSLKAVYSHLVEHFGFLQTYHAFLYWYKRPDNEITSFFYKAEREDMIQTIENLKRIANGKNNKN